MGVPCAKGVSPDAGLSWTRAWESSLLNEGKTQKGYIWSKLQGCIQTCRVRLSRLGHRSGRRSWVWVWHWQEKWPSGIAYRLADTQLTSQEAAPISPAKVQIWRFDGCQWVPPGPLPCLLLGIRSAQASSARIRKNSKGLVLTYTLTVTGPRGPVGSSKARNKPKRRKDSRLDGIPRGFKWSSFAG